MEIGSPGVLQVRGLDRLIIALRAHGYQVIGPRLRDGAIVLDGISSAADLPRGFGDEQREGRYRLRRRGDDAVFGYSVASGSWKTYLSPPRLRLWRVRKAERSFEFLPDGDGPPRYALLGVRPCELAALAIQDRVHCGGPHVDADYQARRRAAFVVAVNCGEAGGTCFCASLGTGPRAAAGFDLALSELLDGRDHRFLLEVGSARGAEVASQLPLRPASIEDTAAAGAAARRAEAGMGRRLETAGLKELMYRSYQSPHWDEVGERCLTCANCTMVCPTCFCVDVEDGCDLAGDQAERRRVWDSCFTCDFSYIHGGSVRGSAGARYRQWLVHKLAAWQDQFGSLGCVGCGRCIAWCPAGIDLTREVRALREREERRR